MNHRLRRPRALRWIAVLAVIAVALVGCGDDDDDGGSPSADAGTDTEQDASSGADLEGTSLRIALTSTGPDELPLWPAIEALEARGVDVETEQYAEIEDATRAMIRGDIDVTVWLATNSVVSAVNAGAEITSIMSFARNRWALVAASEIGSTDDLNGKQIGVHAESSFTKAVADYYIDEFDLSAEIAIVPGSEVRAQALASGQLDATVISLDDVLFLSEQFPGKFHVLQEFAADFPSLMTSVISSSLSFLENEPELAQAFVTEYLRATRAINEDLEYAQEVAQERYADFAPTPELLNEQVQMLVEGGYYPGDGGMTSEICESTVAFLIEADQVEMDGEPDVSQYCNYDLVEAANDELG